jgi:hypothetical protein
MYVRGWRIGEARRQDIPIKVNPKPACTAKLTGGSSGTFMLSKIEKATRGYRRAKDKRRDEASPNDEEEEEKGASSSTACRA